MKFKDHFSDRSSDYTSRPTYPLGLFEFLSVLVEPLIAWDCATGSGQCAISLADYFNKIIATDASQDQIAKAVLHPKIDYKVALSEQSGIPSQSVDLVTVAQALHWFDLDAFFKEVERVVKPGGVLAVWCYDMFGECPTPQIRQAVSDYSQTLSFPKEVELVNSHYETIKFPFQQINTPDFRIVANWDIDRFFSFLNSLSVVNQKSFPFHLKDLWKGELEVSWKLYLKVFRI